MKLNSLNRRVTAVERGVIKAPEQIYFVIIEPPPGVEIDNRTVFQKYEDIPADYFNGFYPPSIYKGIDPNWI